MLGGGRIGEAQIRSADRGPQRPSHLQKAASSFITHPLHRGPASPAHLAQPLLEFFEPSLPFGVVGLLLVLWTEL